MCVTVLQHIAVRVSRKLPAEITSALSTGCGEVLYLLYKGIVIILYFVYVSELITYNSVKLTF
jgi:hypothetical protein